MKILYKLESKIGTRRSKIYPKIGLFCLVAYQCLDNFGVHIIVIFGTLSKFFSRSLEAV